MPEHRGTRWRTGHPGRRELLGALGAGAGIASGLGLPGAAVARAQGPGIAVTDADGRLGAVEAFRAAGTGLVEGAGVRWERLTFWWRGLQEGPGAPLNPFYFPLENVDAERERGMEVVGLLVNTPDWAAADPSRGGTSVPRNLYLPHDHPENYWGRFVRQVVELYRGRIDSWIIWNEPDITPNAPNAAYFLWAGSPADYYQLLKVAALNARAANPGVKILSAAVTYWTDIHLQREQWFSRFLAEVAADPTAGPNGQYFDVCALNLYTNPQNLYTVPHLYHQLMRERGFDKPVWITETNVVPHDDPVNAGSPLSTRAQMRASLDEQADFTVQALAMGLAAGAQRIEVYKMKDGDGDEINGQALLREDLSRRPAYGAFQVGAQHFSRHDSARLYAPGDLRQVVFDSRARRVNVLWSAAPQALSVRVPVSGDGQALFVDRSGDSYPVRASGDAFEVELRPATANTNLEDPGTYLIGGRPVLLVEMEPRRPVQGAQNLTPPLLTPFRPIAARIAGQPGTGSLPD
ncbi:MAG TPA: glycosyl hydrolase [Chloroflexota bacterium]|nr:glycosyl hydrolase [Chloroflexota bacterium]